MAPNRTSIRRLRAALGSEPSASTRSAALAESALSNSNSNTSRNTYLWQDEAWTKSEAYRVAAMPREIYARNSDGWPTLWGIPVSVKDCFDLAGAPTSCGTIFYRDLFGIADRDSWLVEQLR